MIAKCICGLLAGLLLIACIFRFDYAADYTHKAEEGEYVHIDLDDATKVNHKLLDRSLNAVFGFVDKCGNYFRDVLDRGMDMILYVSGGWDYVIEDTLNYDSIEAYDQDFDIMKDTLWTYVETVLPENDNILDLFNTWNLKTFKNYIYEDSNFWYYETSVDDYESYKFRVYVALYESGTGDVSPLNSAEGWASDAGGDAEWYHNLFEKYGISHYYDSTFYKYTIICPSRKYGPSIPTIPEETTETTTE